MHDAAHRKDSTLRKLPAGIWALGCVSLLADVSSEMIHSLLPVFLLSLGGGAAVVGLIEGAAEATAMIVKVFSGALSDGLGRRKGLTVFGYSLGALSKPLFALAPGLGLVVGARLLDRVGKGIRGAPRDALVADLVPAEMRGAAFGLRQALDTVGALIGPLLAVALMVAWHENVRAVFWMAALPAGLSVLVLVLFVREPAGTAQPARTPLSFAQLGRLRGPFFDVLAIGALFSLARFSEAFLVLRARDAGVSLALVPLVLAAMNLSYSVSAYPFGQLSDRMSHARLLRLGLWVLIAADLVLASSTHVGALCVGVLLWGLHMGMTQGLLASMVAKSAPAELRGTAFGVFGLVCGVATLLASVIAGALWDRYGPATTFQAGAGFCVLAWLVAGRRM